MTYYIVGNSVYDGSSYKVYAYCDHGGYSEGDYGTRTDAHMVNYDAYWRLGGSGGQQVAEIGLHNKHRIKITSSGIYKWVGPGDEDFDVIGSGGNLNDLDDVVITTPADNEVLAYNNATTKWINQTPTEAGLSVSGHNHTHNDLSGLNAGDSYEHITQTQKTALAKAIHDNVANEITAITEKTSLAGNDEIIIEDSAASYVKKSVKFSTITSKTKHLPITIFPPNWRTAGSTYTNWSNGGYGDIIQHGYSNSKLLIHFIVPHDFKTYSNITFTCWFNQHVAFSGNYMDIFTVTCEQIADGDAMVLTTAYNDYTINDCSPTKSTIWGNSTWVKKQFTIVGSSFNLIKGNLILMQLTVAWHYAKNVFSAGWGAVYICE